MRRHTIRFWGLPAISALATMLVAATVDPSGNWVRLRAIASGSATETGRKPPEIRPALFAGPATSSPRSRPPDQRTRPGTAGPVSRDRSVATTTGSRACPRTKQDELKEKPPGERMDLIKKLRQGPSCSAGLDRAVPSICRRGRLFAVRAGGDLSDLAIHVAGRAAASRENATRASTQAAFRARERRRRSRRNSSGRHLTRPNGYANSKPSPRITSSLSFFKN